MIWIRILASANRSSTDPLLLHLLRRSFTRSTKVIIIRIASQFVYGGRVRELTRNARRHCALLLARQRLPCLNIRLVNSAGRVGPLRGLLTTLRANGLILSLCVLRHHGL